MRQRFSASDSCADFETAKHDHHGRRPEPEPAQAAVPLDHREFDGPARRAQGDEDRSRGCRTPQIRGESGQLLAPASPDGRKSEPSGRRASKAKTFDQGGTALWSLIYSRIYATIFHRPGDSVVSVAIRTGRGAQMIEGGKGSNSFDETATGDPGARRPYVKPFLRDLDVVDTSGKDLPQPPRTGGITGPADPQDRGGERWGRVS